MIIGKRNKILIKFIYYIIFDKNLIFILYFVTDDIFILNLG